MCNKTQHTCKVWLPDEDKKLAELFPRTDTKKLVEVFNCSVEVIRNRAYRLGMRKDTEWLKAFKSELAIKSYAENCRSGFKKEHSPWNSGMSTDFHRPKKTSIRTGHGFQDVQIVPGGRVITHRISDVNRMTI